MDSKLKLDLNSIVLGFNNQPITFSDGEKVKDMTIRDVFQLGISNYPNNKHDYKSLKHIYSLVTRISEENQDLEIQDPSEQEFLKNLVLDNSVFNPLIKQSVLSKLNAF